jgi:hypothetical protein
MDHRIYAKSLERTVLRESGGRAEGSARDRTTDRLSVGSSGV